jgi:hypothetical protein
LTGWGLNRGRRRWRAQTVLQRSSRGLCGRDPVQQGALVGGGLPLSSIDTGLDSVETVEELRGRLRISASGFVRLSDSLGGRGLRTIVSFDRGGLDFDRSRGGRKTCRTGSNDLARLNDAIATWKIADNAESDIGHARLDIGGCAFDDHCVGHDDGLWLRGRGYGQSGRDGKWRRARGGGNGGNVGGGATSLEANGLLVGRRAEGVEATGRCDGGGRGRGSLERGVIEVAVDEGGHLLDVVAVPVGDVGSDAGLTGTALPGVSRGLAGRYGGGGLPALGALASILLGGLPGGGFLLVVRILHLVRRGLLVVEVAGVAALGQASEGLGEDVGGKVGVVDLEDLGADRGSEKERVGGRGKADGVVGIVNGAKGLEDDAESALVVEADEGALVEDALVAAGDGLYDGDIADDTLDVAEQADGVVLGDGIDRWRGDVVILDLVGGLDHAGGKVDVGIRVGVVVLVGHDDSLDAWPLGRSRFCDRVGVV